MYVSMNISMYNLHVDSACVDLNGKNTREIAVEVELAHKFCFPQNASFRFRDSLAWLDERVRV